MKNNPLISIIIPLYNNEKYILDCLNSIFFQTYERLEVIVINDGSSDNSPQIVDLYAKKEKRLKVFHQENMGVSFARNKGVEYANGKYLSFIDSDDTINLNAYSYLIKKAELSCAEIVLSNILYCYENGETYQIGNRRNLFGNNTIMNGKSCFSKMMESECYIPMVCNNIYRADFLIKNNLFFDPCLHEDELFTPKAFYFAKRVAELDFDFYFYRQSENSIMRSKNELGRIRAKIFVCKELIYFTQNGIDEKNNSFFEWLLVRVIQLLHTAYYHTYNLKVFEVIPDLVQISFVLIRMHKEMIECRSSKSYLFRKEYYEIIKYLRKIHIVVQEKINSECILK